MGFVWRLIVPVIGLVSLTAMLLEARISPDARSMEPAARPTEVGDSRAPLIVAEARIIAYPGAQVVVGSELAGTVINLPVKEKDKLRKGDLVAELRSKDIKAAIEEAEARRREAEAGIRYFEAELKRSENLYRQRAGSRQNADHAIHQLAIVRARRDGANADAGRLRAILEKSRIVAPISGVVLERHIQPGESIKDGSPVVTLADLSKRRVEAEVDEFDVARVKLGMPVAITAEGYDNGSWQGTVEEIPDSVVLRRIKPQDPTRPIDTRVLLVKVALPPDAPFKLGQRVEVRIAAAEGRD
jgi:RND family efflux transporter MFP subunit